MRFDKNMLRFDEIFFNEFNGYTIYFIVDKEETPNWLKQMFKSEKEIEHYELSIELVSGDEYPFVQVSPTKIIDGVHTDYDWKDLDVTEEELLFLLKQTKLQINNRRI